MHQPPFSTFQMSEILLLLPLAFGEIEKVGPPSLFRQNIGGKKGFLSCFSLSFVACPVGGALPFLRPTEDQFSFLSPLFLPLQISQSAEEATVKQKEREGVPPSSFIFGTGPAESHFRRKRKSRGKYEGLFFPLGDLPITEGKETIEGKNSEQDQRDFSPFSRLGSNRTLSEMGRESIGTVRASKQSIWTDEKIEFAFFFLLLHP